MTSECCEIHLKKSESEDNFNPRLRHFYIRSSMCVTNTYLLLFGVFFQCVMAVFTCMGSHMSSQVAGLAETLPTLIAEILSLPHERPQHPCAHKHVREETQD